MTWRRYSYSLTSLPNQHSRSNQRVVKFAAARPDQDGRTERNASPMLVCLTQALYSGPGVQELLAGEKIEEFNAPVRVEGNAREYRVTRRS